MCPAAGPTQHGAISKPWLFLTDIMIGIQFTMNGNYYFCFPVFIYTEGGRNYDHNYGDTKQTWILTSGEQDF